MIAAAIPTLFVADMDKAIHFYTVVLGLKLAFRAESFWAEVETSPGQTMGIHPKSQSAGEPGTPGPFQLGLRLTGTVEEAQARLREHGVEFEGAIVEEGGVGRFAYLRDMDGNKIYLWQSA